MRSSKRQKTLSFKVTDEIEQALLSIRVRMIRRMNKDVTKTDVIEEAIRELAKREKVSILER